MGLDHVGRYEIQRRLGTGGMGSLYLARDPHLDRLVAIKLLKDDFQDDEELRERFSREARSVARLSHPNIVVVFDVGVDGGRPFMAMEYIAGETLTTVLRRQPPLPLQRRLSLVEDICAGLEHAHGVGIVHRDIKPANVMLDADGVVKILDFGIARLGNHAGMTQDGAMMGSVNYMSPEQVVGRGVDHRTDIFATGAILYEVVALEQAFPGGMDSGVLHRILTQGPAPIQQIVPGSDPQLVEIVEHALHRDSAQRYQDMTSLRRDIARVRRRLVDQGAEPAVGPSPDATRIVQVRTPPPAAGARPGSDRPRRLSPERLAELRRQQIGEHLRSAEEALGRGDYEAALQYAERAATIDPESRLAFDMIDKARVALEVRAVRRLVDDARRSFSAGNLAEASALAAEALATLAGLPDADELGREVRRLADEIADARDREQRIDASLERARASLEQGGYETALRAVYEVLALDPERPQARELEDRAKSGLQAKREHEQARSVAYARVRSALDLAHQGRFADATELLSGMVPPSDTVRVAAEKALGEVEALRRKAAALAVIVEARAALAEGQFELALERLDAIDPRDGTEESRSLHVAAMEGLRQERALAQKHQLVEDALAAAGHLMEKGDLEGAYERLQEAAVTGLEDERIAMLRHRIGELVAAAEAKRRQDERDRVAAKRVETARQQFAKGDRYAALALLERDGSDHHLVESTLREFRARIAEDEERLRREVERKKQEEEARRQAELEAERLLEEQRQAVETERAAAEQKRRDEEGRLREAVLRNRERLSTLLSFAEQTFSSGPLADAADTVREAEGISAVEDGALTQRLTAVKRESERRRRARRQFDDALALARRFLAEGKLPAALEAVEAALTLDSRDDAAVTLRSQIQQEIERRQEAARKEEDARREQEEARKLDEQISATLVKARRVKAHDAALDLLNEALTLNPADRRIRQHIRERREAQEAQRLEEARIAEEERRAKEREERERRQREEEQARSERERQRERAAEEEREQAGKKAGQAEEKRQEVMAAAERTAPAFAPTGDRAIARPTSVHAPRRPATVYVAGAAAGIVLAIIVGAVVYRTGPNNDAAVGGEQPASPQAAAPQPTSTNPPAPVAPISAPPGVETGVDDPNQRIVQQLAVARQLLARGDVANALAAVQSALRQSPTNSDARTLLDTMARDARASVQVAKQEAGRAGPQAGASEAYQNAGAIEVLAERERSANRIDRALPLWWRARDQFLLAARIPREVTAAPVQPEEVPQVVQGPPTVPDPNPPGPQPPAPRPQPPPVASPPPPRPEPAPAAVDETAAIAQTLRAYEAAWASLNADAVRRVHEFSSEELARVRTSLAAAQKFEVSVQIQDIKVSADNGQATVTARVRRTFVPKSAAKPSDTVLINTFTLAKRDSSWVIVGMR